jgi:hypothetical protein
MLRLPIVSFARGALLDLYSLHEQGPSFLPPHTSRLSLSRRVTINSSSVVENTLPSEDQKSSEPMLFELTAT